MHHSKARHKPKIRKVQTMMQNEVQAARWGATLFNQCSIAERTSSFLSAASQLTGSHNFCFVVKYFLSPQHVEGNDEGHTYYAETSVIVTISHHKCHLWISSCSVMLHCAYIFAKEVIFKQFLIYSWRLTGACRLIGLVVLTDW